MCVGGRNFLHNILPQFLLPPSGSDHLVMSMCACSMHAEGRKHHTHVKYFTPIHALTISLTCCIFLFSAPNGGSVYSAAASTDKKEAHFLDRQASSQTQTSMGHEKSFSLHMLVWSPSCSSLQGSLSYQSVEFFTINIVSWVPHPQMM